MAFDRHVVGEGADAGGDQLEQLDGIRLQPRAADVEEEPLRLLDQLDAQAFLGDRDLDLVFEFGQVGNAGNGLDQLIPFLPELLHLRRLG